ncbi:MAG: oxidoreductase [Lentisphaerae bacterium GWF2_45_14]|nr:MAG: oxidoreductase [Lentisphaerae bacterium GWF2_45_14]
MNKSPLRIGIVGSGFAANFHYASYSRQGTRVSVEGCYSPTEEKRKKFASEKGIRAFNTFDEMLEHVDVVDICAPGNVHELYAVEAANAGKHAIVEKPFTGYYGPENAPDNWRGDKFPKITMFEKAVESASKIVSSAEKNNITLCYAENWVYAPAVKKEAEILRASKGQILWIIGEESHSGSHSPAYGIWKKSGGGSIVGKGCHPLTAALYLKQLEGIIQNGNAIRPKSVSARTHSITQNPKFRDAGFLRSDYYDVEDFCQMHIVFEDSFVADIFSNEIVMGGVHNYLEVFANNHRMRCNINPVDACTLYNPKDELLKDVYLTEKLGTKQGWSFPSPDEDWMTGYPQEIDDFLSAIENHREPECGKSLGLDTVSVMYGAYLSAERKGQEVELP